MNTSLESEPSGQTALRITADWPEVAADYDDLLSEYVKLALPGFRPGKAPRPLIEQRFRQQLRDDFTARCGRRLVREVLRERNLRAAGPIPVVAIQFEPHQAFSFTAECVPVPKLELPDYACVPLTATSDEERRDELSAWLLERTAWDVPEPLVRQECARGETAAPGSDAWDAAGQRVKLMVILDQIAEAEGIESDAQAVDVRIEKMASECNVKPDKLRRQLGEDGVSLLHSLLRAEQTLDYLLANASAGSNTKPNII